jgi:hypothetical protein
MTDPSQMEASEQRALTESQQAAIEEEVKERPLYGPLEPIATLVQEFDRATSPTLHERAKVGLSSTSIG